MSYDPKTFELELTETEWLWKMRIGKGRVATGTAPRTLNDEEAHKHAVKYVNDNWEEIIQGL